jgi:peptidoglycan/LPS O-acetylase OafA/YrhL
MTAQRSPLIRPFYPALDGVRAIAILLVFTWHYCRPVSNSAVFTWGWIGVNIFFVLSGFLITGILVDSLDRPNFFRNFYVRRSLRIFPLYYAIWLFFLLATPLLHFQWNRYVVAMAFYFGNFFKGGMLIHPDPGILLFTRHPDHTSGILVDHFWSLCVEEQFYLVWPLLVWVIRSRRQLLWLCLCMVALGPIGRAAYQLTHASTPNYNVLYYNSFARADALFLGAAVAIWLRISAPTPRALRWLALTSLIAPPLLLVSLRSFETATFLFPVYDPLILTIGFTLINIASAGLLLLAIESKSILTSILQLRPLVLIGRVSYGLYIFNELIFLYITGHMRHVTTPFTRFLFPIVAFIVTLAISLLSFRYIESPFLSLKKKLAPRPGATEDPPPVESFAALATDTPE